MRFILPLLMFASITILGQSAKQKIADKMFDELNLFEAAQVYEEIALSKNRDYHCIRRTADCYRMMNNTLESEVWYTEVIEFGTEDPLDYYYLANAMKSNGKVSEVDKLLTSYAELTGGEYTEVYSSFVESNKENEANFEVANLELNSKYSDFGAVLRGAEIIFTSNRVSSFNEGETVGWDNTVFNDTYLWKEGDEKSTLLFSNKMTKGLHDGPVAILDDKIYVTRNLKVKNGRKVLELDVVANDGKEWITESKFSFDSESYSIGHAAFSKDGKKMVFVSDKPGGIGETDIWYSDWKNGEWAEPVNFGAEINTFDKELFPYLADNGDLYFSSLGHTGLGGLDLFVCYLIDGEYKAPENLGYPVNTRFDDFSFMYKNENEAYFSSNRIGGKGSDDIYKADITIPFKYSPPITDTISPIFDLARDVLIITASEKFEGGIVKLTNTKTGEVIEKLLKKGENDIQLEDKSDYVVEFSKDGFFSSTSELRVDSSLEKIKPFYDVTGNVLTLSTPDKFAGGTVKITNVLTGEVIEQTLVAGNTSIELTDESSYVLEFSKEGYQTSRSALDVSSSTEKIKPSYSKNGDVLTLSIPEKYDGATIKLTNVKTGEVFKKTLTVGDNEFQLDSGTDYVMELSKEGFMQSRTELIGTEAIKPEMNLDGDVLTITSPDKYAGGTIRVTNVKTGEVIERTILAGENIFQLEDGEEYTIEFVKDGFLESKTQIKVGGTDNGQLSRNNKNQGVIENVYFDSNSSYFDRKGRAKLDAVVSALESNSNMKITINAYADFIGEDSYNMYMSKRRGKRVYDYLISKGVDDSRVSYYFFGETNPVFECSDQSECDNEDLRVNRRVEFVTNS